MTDILLNVRWQKWKCLRFWFWHYRWDIQFKADWRITGQKRNSFALHSMDKQWHMLGTITYYAFYISRTIIGMELTEQTVENTRPTWNYKDELSKILHPFQIFGSRWSHCEIQGRIVFKQYIPKKNHKRFGIKMFKLCDSTGYTYDMNVYLGKDRQRAAQHLTATHNTLVNLTRGVEGFGHKLYMDNFFPSPDLYDDLTQKKIFCCGTVRLYRKGMPKDHKPKTLRMKGGDIRVRTRGDLTAVVWKDPCASWQTSTIHPEKAIIAMNTGMR